MLQWSINFTNSLLNYKTKNCFISHRVKHANLPLDPYNDLPTVEMGVNADDLAPPPSTVRSESPKPHLERRDDVDEKRQRRRQKSEDRKRKYCH